MKIEFANTMRGVAAMLVLVSHYLGVFWTNREGVSRYTLLPPLPEQFSTPTLVEWLHFSPWVNWGALGVGLFFLISGFVIPFSLRGRNRVSFATARSWRLIPTYAAGFSLTLVALFLGIKLVGSEWPFSAFEVAVHYVPGLRDHFQSPNIDGIIWTLEVEVKFYIVAALLSPLFQKKSLIILLVPVFLVFFSKIYMHYDPILAASMPMAAWLLRPFAFSSQFLCLMFIGATFHLLFVNAVGVRTAVIFIAVGYACFSYLWSDFASDASVGAFVGYSVSIIIFSASIRFSPYFRPHPVTTFFANISYPLYVVHAVAGYIIMYALLLNGWYPGWAILSATAISVTVATLLHYLVERPTQAIGRGYSERRSTLHLSSP